MMKGRDWLPTNASQTSPNVCTATVSACSISILTFHELWSPHLLGALLVLPVVIWIELLHEALQLLGNRMS